MKASATVAGSINKKLKYVRKFAPSLVVARATLIPFDDLFVNERAGPQGDDDSFGSEPYFSLHAPAGGDFADIFEFVVTANSVTCRTLAHDDDGFAVLDEWESNLQGVYEYLRQLQRPPHSFCKRRKGVRQ
jgi:hypothetical protein